MTQPYRVHGSEASYFTGKLEAVLLYKEIPYELVTERAVPNVTKHTRVFQVPALELPDGRWATDTTPIIAWLDREGIGEPVIPVDPLQRFFSLLLEDFGDEWLWRPAMHYRWSYRIDALYRSRFLAEELGGHIRAPEALKRLNIRRRQLGTFVTRDGVDAGTWDHVEAQYLRTLEWMEALLATQRYLLGDRPSVADYGLFGSMFRHFAIDPTPASIMRTKAPRVYEWVARVWAARASSERGALCEGVPESWGPVLSMIGATHLPALVANARAFEAGEAHHDLEVEGVRYRRLRTSRYRVWCLEELQRELVAMPEPARAEARGRLDAHGAWAPLVEVEGTRSGVDPDGAAPFVPAVSMTGM